MDSILNGFVAATATATFLIMASILANSGGAVADCTPLLSSDPSVLDDSCKILFMRRHYKWEVEYVFGTPDWMEHCLKGIDGQFPGPTIRAKAGDTISFEVTNGLHTEGLIIHWHGITELGTAIPWADGTASVSQYTITINPGETFLYMFKVNKTGSYFFHVHFGMQRSARLYGSLIGAKAFIRQSRKLLNDEDKRLGESKASVHGSGSKTSPSEEYTQGEDKEFEERKASVSGSVSEPAPSE